MNNLFLAVALAAVLCAGPAWARSVEMQNEPKPTDGQQNDLFKSFISECEARVSNVPVPAFLESLLAQLRDQNPSGNGLSIYKFANSKGFVFGRAEVLQSGGSSDLVQICAKFMSEFTPRDDDEDPICNTEPFMEDPVTKKAFIEEVGRHALLDKYLGLSSLCLKY